MVFGSLSRSEGRIRIAGSRVAKGICIWKEENREIAVGVGGG
jgi:hypothetical protein